MKGRLERLRIQADQHLFLTLFAGDSGNDLLVLTSHVPSVLAANAMPEVTEPAIVGAKAKGNL